MSGPIKRLFMTVEGDDGVRKLVAIDAPDYDDWWDHIEAFDDLFGTDLWGMSDEKFDTGLRLVQYLPDDGDDPLPDLVVQDADDVAELRRILEGDE